MVAVAAAAVIAVFALSVTRTTGQTQRIARIDGKPNISGIWEAFSDANWDLEAHAAQPGFLNQVGVHPLALVPAAPALAMGSTGSVRGAISVVEGGTIPYKPDALKQKLENKAIWIDRDPEVRCFVGGIPRSIYLPHPFQIFHSTNKIEFVFSYSSTGRTVNLDKVDPLPDDTSNGFAQGRWEGDTLVVDSTGFDDKTWLSRSGDFHSNQMTVRERFTPAGNINDMFALRYEAEITDPVVFTRPWKISLPLYRHIEPNAQLMEFRCIEFVEELAFGHLRRQQLVRTWAGTTLDVNITRKVPAVESVLYQRHWVNPWLEKAYTQK
jgi:hypothetical protein